MPACLAFLKNHMFILFKKCCQQLNNVYQQKGVVEAKTQMVVSVWSLRV